MPKKNSDPSLPEKPKKAAAAKRKPKAAPPEQADLFEDVSVAPPSPKKRAAVSKTPKAAPPKPKSVPVAPAPKPPRPQTVAASAKAAATDTVADTKQHIPKIPYASVLVVGYVALVLAWDALVTVGDTRTVNWAVFQWRPADLQVLLESLKMPHALVGWLSLSFLTHVDLFKIVFWLAIPLAICFWRLDWDYFTRRRIKPVDWLFLVGMCCFAVFSIVGVRFIPVLAHQYRGLGQVALSMRMQFLIMQLLWVFSWLPGWEFMHRYFLLRRVSVDFPRFGWLLVPLAEGVYHLLKPWPETVAMVVFSIIMTQYAIRRKNIVIPFLAHLAVEVFLIIGMVLW